MADKDLPVGYEETRQDLMNRLRRIEGQVRGVQRMLDDNRNCVEVLTQLAAVSQSLRKVSLMISETHAKNCVSRAIASGHGDEVIEELINVMFKFTR